MRVMHNQKKLRKWADHAPMNFLHKYYLVEAEQARVLGNGKKAVEFYFKSIELADQNGYLQEQALAYELAARFYLSKSNFDMGEECIRNAYYHYVKWGALGKAKQLKARYVKLLTVDFEQSTHPIAIHTTSTSTSDMLDNAAIIKATQAISGEIVLEQLLRKLVKIVLEYAGAQRVYFIVKKDQDLVVEAEGILEGQNITVLQSIPIRKSFKIPISIINYVYRTKEDVVLSVASISEKFMMDPYIAKEKPKSILCTAVMNKRKLVGILYLENNLLSGAFTENRIKILSIICSQLAIALENASLYNSLALHKNNLENLVEERTRKLSETNKALQETTTNIRSLLNHAGQGFLSIRADLVIQPDYSTECLRIFHTRIEGMYFPHLIYPTDCEDRNTMEQILHTIFQQNTSKQKLIYLSLLPQEITLYEQHIEIEYKLIENQWSENPFMTLMVILTDVTEKRLLEKQALEEQSTLRMVVKVVADFADFMDCVKGYEEFYTERLQEILQSPLPPLQQLFEIYRSIHTFKGSFSQYELSSIVSKLHQLESELSAFKDTVLVEQLPLAEIPDFTALLSPQDMKQWLSEELDILQNILGKQYFTKDHSINIDQDKLLEIEAKMQSILSPAEYIQLLPLIRQLRYRPLAELIKGYPAYVQNLSDRLEKYVHPFIIQADEFLVDPELYLPFAKSLIHIFRNCMDHGIESPEQRMDIGKDEYGTIQCKIHKDHDHIILSIEDDGQGIDTAKVRNKAVQKGILNIQEAETISEAQVVELIFMDELSTKDAVTQVSGRGIGMSSVKKEVDALKGSIQVTSSLHMGTKFVITLPK
jgi:GAF domain-containing protein/signal transduction histidine kinase